MNGIGSASYSAFRQLAQAVPSRAEFGDLLFFIFLAVFVRQYLWIVNNEVLAWLITLILTSLIWLVYVGTRQAIDERPERQFWLIVAVPLFLVYAMRVAFIDFSTDVATYHIALAERSLRGFPFIAGDFLPFFTVNPAPDMITGLSRHLLGYRLGTFINYLTMLWLAAILFKILNRFPGLSSTRVRGVAVLVILFTEHMLFEINNYMVDLLSLPLLLEATFLVLRAGETEKNKFRHVQHVALLAGMSVAFKLTNLAFVIPLLLVYGHELFIARRSFQKRDALMLLLGLVVFCLPLLPFTLLLYRDTGSPVFPFFNWIFKSPYWPDWRNPGGWDGRWGPEGFWQTLFWPLLLHFKIGRVGEISVYSGRLAIGFVVAIICLFARVDRRLRTLSFIMLLGSLLWSAVSGYVRYASYLELVGGVLIIGLAASLLASESGWLRKLRWALSVLILGLTGLQVLLAGAYVSRYEWAMRPTVFKQPKNFLRESRNFFRDRSLAAWLTPETRAPFDKVEVWVDSVPKTAGIALLLKDAPVVSTRVQEFFVNSISRERFARTIGSLRDKKMFALTFAENMSQSLDILASRGLKTGRITDVTVPFYSSKMNLGMSLIEVLPVEGIDANLDRPSADTTQHGGPYRYSMSTMNPPARMKTGQHLLLTIRLKNLSDITWSQRGQTGSQYPVTIGNHWLDLENRMIKHDDGRSTIPRDLNPQEETELPLSVIAPSTPGEYVLEIDMLIEGVTWFSQAGAKTARLHVSVEP